MNAEVVRVTITRQEITAEGVPELAELFGLERLPLAPAKVEIELRGVPTAVANALRRAVIDEMPGRCLQVPPGGFDSAESTDPFMLPQFVNQLNLAVVPLRPQIPPETVKALRLGLDVTNPGTSALAVYTGDLEVTGGSMPEPLFNPTFQIATLQPGKRIVIRGIYISTGYGRDHAAYQVARRGAARPLDIPEHPEADTHDAPTYDAEGRQLTGAAADWSGFRVSCLVADPRRHLVSAVLPATGPDLASIRAVFADACANVKGRLRLVAAAVELHARAAGPGRERAGPPPGAADQESAGAGVQFTVVQLQEGLSEGILQVAAETHTIGELLRRAVHDLNPDLVFAAYEIISHENRLRFTVRHTGDVARVLLQGAQHCIAVFEAIQRGIMAAR